MPARFVLFDLGRVVLDWEPARLYAKMFESEKQRDWFLENVCTMTWHTQHDAGATFAETAPPLIAQYPDYESEIRAWGGRWMEMFGGYISGTPDLMDRLAERNVPLYALSNMPEEVWPDLLDAFPKLKMFRHTVVSGALKQIKPDPAIYTHTLEKMGDPSAEEVFFIDDSAPNIAAADALGFRTHLFRGAAKLEQALRDEGLL